MTTNNDFYGYDKNEIKMLLKKDTSQHLTQGAIAFFEAVLFFDGKITKNMAFAAIVFVSAYVPSQGWGYGLLNARTEALWETLVAMLLSMIIVTPIWDGGIMKNALKAFVLSTSSYAVLEQLNILFRGGADPRYNSYRNQFEPPTKISLMTLG